jgi:ribosome maturation factor RimP
MSVIEVISSTLAPIIADSGFYLEDVTLSSDLPKILTVIIDGDTPLNLDQVTSVTKEISEILEHLPELGDFPFTLEVSSPGIDRPLTLPRHWRKNLGRLVTITLQDGSVVKGRIGELVDHLIKIDERELALSDIARAQVEIEFKSLKKGDQE